MEENTFTQYKPGDKVVEQEYGFGVVTGIVEDGARDRYYVEFDQDQHPVPVRAADLRPQTMAEEHGELGRAFVGSVLRDHQKIARRLVFECAGAATRPLLEDHPDYTFPSERVAAAVEHVLREWGFPPEEDGQ